MTQGARMIRWLGRQAVALHRRLLPDDRDIGWTPYLWLIYLNFFFIEWYFRPVPTWELTLSAGILCVFLWGYFRSFWVTSRRRLPLVLLITGIGLLMTPFNAGSVVFFIYAGASAGTLQPRRLALGMLAAVILVFLIQATILSLELQYWLVGTLISAFIGLANIYFTHVASENASLRLNQAEVRALATARERERISRDLHDLLGQSLSLISLKAQLARRLVDTEPARARDELVVIESQARQVLEQIRDAVRGYRRASLASEAADARVTLGSREIDFHYRLPDRPLAGDVDAELALVVREAVTNVLRHAQADECRLLMTREDETLSLRFSDNGQAGTLTEGGGLAGMRRRVEGLGGHLRIDTTQGLVLEAAIPNAFRHGHSSPREDRAA